tara:strand:- start:370 stop:741 length:372 start_codon:yes stop_codon:yes gene_type:complete
MSSNRPLSPHLSIHKKVLTATLSIFHRFTGIFLSIGSIFISIWIFLIALGPSYYNLFEFISSNLVFKIFLFLWTICIFYHLFNGIRYLFWSFGKGMDLKIVYLSGYLVVLLSIITSVLVWTLI